MALAGSVDAAMPRSPLIEDILIEDILIEDMGHA